MRTPGFDLLSLEDQQLTVQRVHSRFIDIARKTLIAEDLTLQTKIGEMSEARKAQGLFYKPD